ncbi:MAG: UpxY family transcription antiterminator [Bacteroidetes bacterium]|nr:UpxY family transcription antiterminator [Bacteroidota bacterium]
MRPPTNTRAGTTKQECRTTDTQRSTDTIWRAFYTRPRHERKAAARLEEAGIEVYCPTVTTKVRWSDRWKKVTKVLFTSYVFARVDEKQRITVLEDEGISRCVLYLGKPATIRDEEIEAIRFLLDAGTDVTVH